MATRTIEEQLVTSLRDAHALEQMALAQLERAPSIAGEDALRLALRDHWVETRVHERLVRERLDAHGAKPSTLRDLAAEAGGAGFILFARAQADTPGKLATHAFSYEHLELAAYELLVRLAEIAGDHETAVVAHRIRGEEAAMAARLEATFERTATASLSGDDPGKRLMTYLDDAHALEQQAVTLLERSIAIGGDPQLEDAYHIHLEETRDHLAALEQLIARRDGGVGGVRFLKDAALSLGARNIGAFFRAQADTPGKLAAFAYAFEHLEIGGYEQLRRIAQLAGDIEAAEVATRILGDERAAAETLFALFDVAVEASLEAVGAQA